ncbi:hypothetical protein JZ751_024632 [Albula glossodonta]|uniref:P/Homo B domain-containing protein n=1 Tax=Albula glossodonta TaxID=121402 RepID=A0A8T2PBI4_9TELE|nr:hypothetical protein JZ751_024632 [Albula glossodonta]
MNDNDANPEPPYSKISENRHGTRCAGVAAAVANNTVCGVGVAFQAKIGIRMLDGHVTDLLEAKSLNFNQQHIHIYSASWGPKDDGKTVDGPGTLASKALIQGISNGRGGLGSIYVWASGNGGTSFDNCNCDGYSSSIYTVSVGSATERGTVPYYSEPCSAIITTTYSGGSWHHRRIVTTDVWHSCTSDYTGTSASAPLAAGIIALALEANHYYGYGLLDAVRLVDLARKWDPVQPQRKCLTDVITSPHELSGKLMLKWNETACLRTKNWIRSLEHVQARLTLTYTHRGALAIILTSPMGTRPFDTSRKGYYNWAFMSTHSWDEDPSGLWTLQIENHGDSSNRASHSTHWTIDKRCQMGWSGQQQ